MTTKLEQWRVDYELERIAHMDQDDQTTKVPLEREGLLLAVVEAAAKWGVAMDAWDSLGRNPNYSLDDMGKRMDEANDAKRRLQAAIAPLMEVTE